MTPSLSETFEPPSTTTYGPLRVVGQPAQHVDLGRDQAAHRVRQPLRDVVDRRLLAVHDAEAVGDEGVGERGELVGERAALGVVLAGLARVEPDVLQHRDLAVARAPSTVAVALSPTVSVAKATGRAEQLAEPRRRPGAREYAGSGAPLGRPRWATTTTRAPASASAWMVGTLARIRPSSVIVRAVERDVEVGADQDPLAPEVAEVSMPDVASGTVRASRRRG